MKKWMTARILLTLLGMFAIAATSVYFYVSGWHPSDKKYPLQGIDVSNHQGVIQWEKLPSQGVDFAYIKATEGGDFVDKAFQRNWQAAGKADIKRGAYHFFTLCKSGQEQAANFTRNVPFDQFSLPPAVDLEFLGNCENKLSTLQLRSELSQYLDLIEAKYKQKAVLYLTKEFDEKYQISKNFDQPFWLRSIVREPDFGHRPWYLWQMSNFRRLDGISGRVDWNAISLQEFTKENSSITVLSKT
jgi:lysozyme